MSKAIEQALSAQEHQVYQILERHPEGISSSDIADRFFDAPIPLNAQQRTISFLRFIEKKLVHIDAPVRLHKRAGKKDGPGRPHHVFWLAAR